MYSKLVTHSLPNQNNNQDTKDNHENNCKRNCHNQDNLVQVLTFWVYRAVIHREIGQTGWAPTHFGVRINSDLTDCRHLHVHNVIEWDLLQCGELQFCAVLQINLNLVEGDVPVLRFWFFPNDVQLIAFDLIGAHLLRCAGCIFGRSKYQFGTVGAVPLFSRCFALYHVLGVGIQLG